LICYYYVQADSHALVNPDNNNYCVIKPLQILLKQFHENYVEMLQNKSLLAAVI